MDQCRTEARWTDMTYKLALLVVTLAVIPLLFVNFWLGLAAAIAAYAIVAMVANRRMDDAYLKALKRVRLPRV